MRRNGRRGVLLALAIATSACADRNEEPGRYRLAGSYGPADGPMLVLEIYDEPLVHGCDTVPGESSLVLAFDASDDGGAYEFDDGDSDSWGRFVDDDGEEHEVVAASLVIVSRDDGLAHVSYTAVVPDLPEMSDELVDIPSCPPPKWK